MTASSWAKEPEPSTAPLFTITPGVVTGKKGVKKEIRQTMRQEEEK